MRPILNKTIFPESPATVRRWRPATALTALGDFIFKGGTSIAINLEKLGVTEQEALDLITKKKKRKDRERRNWTKQRVFIKKAKAAGITVSDEEIDAELAKKE